MSRVFSVESLSAGYSRDIAVKGVSFSISKGEFVSLIGPNGAGKSTLLKLLSGMMQRSGGEISFMGRNLDDYSRKELASLMSVVSTITGDIPDFSVRMFMSFGRFPFRKLFSFNDSDGQIIDQTASLCGVEHLLNRSIRELSAGEFQLVQVARALVQNRDILLLDEPVSNLDYRHMIQVMEILSSLNRTGSTIICALHDVNIAAEFSSRILAVKSGTVLFDGRPEDVITENTLSALYDTGFHCGKNPVTGRPAVYPVPGLPV